MNTVNESSNNVRGESLDSPLYALEQCPYCDRFVPDVYRHTALDDCDVVNQQVADIISGTLKF